MKERRPKLLFDGRSGESLTYDDLRRELANEVVFLNPVCRPQSAVEAVRAFVKAVVTGQELVLLDPAQTEAEISAMGFSPKNLSRREEVRGKKLPEDPVAWWDIFSEEENSFKLTLFTSGTTGQPKRAVHSLKSLARMVRRSSTQQSSVWGMGYHPTHIAGIQVLVQALANGNPLVLLHGIDGESSLSLMAKEKITHLAASPSFFRQIPKGSPPSTTVRSLTLGAEPARQEDFSRLRDLFPQARLRNAYASTEAGTLLMGEEEVLTIPPESKELVRIQDGQIFVAASAWRATLKDRVGEDWIPTGDRVEWVDHKPGWFRILGRQEDSISTGGWQVNPHEVEAALREFPGIKDCRVYGRKNSLLGNVVAADIVTSDSSKGVMDSDIRRFLADRLQNHKLPRFIRRVAEVPRTRTGKIRRL
ncbi:MAG: fatty acid--CoA ligase family protein [Opitutales bacterium]|nr:fatty acid--CoA ligase family protein [Opitutales bacterium]